MKYSIYLKHVSKSFDLERPRTFKRLISTLEGKSYQRIDVIKDITLKIMPGETVGIYGSNGSGKSTALRIISRIITPDRGKVIVNGKIASIIELGSGLHEDLSGLDNIFLYASILGIPHNRIKKYLSDIITFSELENFVDIPIKKYSSGMKSRLAFSVAIFSDADILLFDEVFAVGDMAFKEKSIRILEKIKKDKTIVLTSHDWGLMSQVCDRFLILENGEFVNQKNEIISSFLQKMNIGKSYIAIAKSNSMYPYIRKGDSISIKKGKFIDVKIRDVIAFKLDIIPEIIVHRVVDIIKSANNIKLITRGDNSIGLDSFEVKKKNYLGIVTKVN